MLTIKIYVARVAEVRFLRCMDWVYRSRFKITDNCWTEMIQVKKYAMPCVIFVLTKFTSTTQREVLVILNSD